MTWLTGPTGTVLALEPNPVPRDGDSVPIGLDTVARRARLPHLLVDLTC